MPTGITPVYADPAPQAAGIRATPVYGTAPGGGLPIHEVYIGENEQKLLDTYGLGRGIRLLSILDCFLLILWVIVGGLFHLILLWGPVSGFVGSTQYKGTYIRVYMAYFVLRIIMDAAFVILGYYWYIISFFIDCWILHYVFVFLRLLQSCTHAEIEQLRDPQAAYTRARPYFIVF
mmetsp:Transcript_31086/g.98684  ORF Transcript_31086/g.98684 Transcript_31086/m.98684 type:complete len:176 (-) Transcript_31086:296-823(-)